MPGYARGPQNAKSKKVDGCEVPHQLITMKVTWGIFLKHWDYNEITGYELYKFTIYQRVEDFATIHSRIVASQKAYSKIPTMK